jgi:hypothetical protein
MPVHAGGPRWRVASIGERKLSEFGSRRGWSNLNTWKGQLSFVSWELKTNSLPPQNDKQPTGTQTRSGVRMIGQMDFSQKTETF